MIWAGMGMAAWIIAFWQINRQVAAADARRHARLQIAAETGRG